LRKTFNRGGNVIKVKIKSRSDTARGEEGPKKGAGLEPGEHRQLNEKKKRGVGSLSGGSGQGIIEGYTSCQQVGKRQTALHFVMRRLLTMHRGDLRANREEVQK